MTIALAYIPVLHRGYVQFLQSEPLARLVLLSPAVIPASITYLKKDLRALDAHQMQRAIGGLQLGFPVEIATEETLVALAGESTTLLLPDEEISQAVIEQYWPGLVNTDRIKFSPIFLRWDKKTATAEKNPRSDQIITGAELTHQLLAQAYTAAGNATDWWRHVGAVVAKDGLPLVSAFNQQLPSSQQSYLEGDARALFHAGDHLELTSAIHAEAGCIAHAARAGISLEGADIYVTTFPCPPCAKLVAQSGIRRLYFSEGYAVFDGETILRAAGVQIVKVDVPSATRQLADARSTVVPYSQS